VSDRKNEFIMLFMITLVKTITNYYDVINSNYPENLDDIKMNLSNLKLEHNYKVENIDNIEIINTILKELKDKTINNELSIKNESNLLLHSKIFNNNLDLFLYFLKRFIYNFESEIINHYSNVRVYISINPYSSIEHDKKHNWSDESLNIDETLNRITYNKIKNETSFKEIFYEKKQNYNLENELDSKIIKNDIINMEFNNLNIYTVLQDILVVEKHTV